jgi:hypothetical protein
VHMHHPHWREPAENGYFKLSRHFKWALNEVRGLDVLSVLFLARFLSVSIYVFCGCVYFITYWSVCMNVTCSILPI